MNNGHEPATKQDLAALKQDLAAVKQDVAAVKQDVAALGTRLSQEVAGLNERHDMLRSELHHSFDHLEEAMRGTDVGHLIVTSPDGRLIGVALRSEVEQAAKAAGAAGHSHKRLHR